VVKDSQDRKETSMEEQPKVVDGFRFLPPGLAAWIRTFIPKEGFQGEIPWTPLAKPLAGTCLALVTSAGISLKTQPPFDMEREKREPLWGDPTWRAIPRATSQQDIEVNHLHVNTRIILEDVDVIFPLHRMAELEEEGVIGALAPHSYSFYGYQFKSTGFLESAIAPIAKQMREEGVEAVLLTPT
jgi:D-proline reductase (dithiol) PrdB